MLHPAFFAVDLVFTLLAAICCGLIFFKTREMFLLTHHDGIRYFRDAFLFFGLSYFIRFIFMVLFLSARSFEFFFPREVMIALFILPLGYLSTVGILSLIGSSGLKQFRQYQLSWAIHIGAIALCVIAFFSRSFFILVMLQCLLLVIGIFVAVNGSISDRRITQARILYLLVSSLWLINLLIIDRRRPFSFEIEIVSQVLSLVVLIVIYFKISKWMR